MVLLAGAVRQSRFFSAIDRSPLDLPITQELTLLDLWRREIDRLAEALGLPDLACRVVVGGNTRAPALRPQSRLSIERDPAALRGTGGLLHDLARPCDDDDYLIVATATQLPSASVEAFVTQALAEPADVSILHDLTGTPPGHFVIACRALRQLPARGFVDFKEQALPLIARRHSVRVLGRAEPIAIPIRTAENYLDAVRVHADQSDGSQPLPEPFRERWRSRFAIIEPGAKVHPGARLHNAVVLGGARVEAEAVLANSVVCSGACVEERLVNQVASEDDVFSIFER